MTQVGRATRGQIAGRPETQAKQETGLAFLGASRSTAPAKAGDHLRHCLRVSVSPRLNRFLR